MVTGIMMEEKTKAQHLAEMQNYFTHYFKDKPNNTAILTAIAQQLADLEELFANIGNLLDIDYAEGAQLDVIGRILNQSREGCTDEQYRLYLKAKALIIRSTGTAEELIAIMKLLTGSRIRWEESYAQNPDDFATAKMIFIDPFDTDKIDVNRLQKIKDLAKPAGVNLLLQYEVSDPFTFDTLDLGWDDGNWGGGY